MQDASFLHRQNDFSPAFLSRTYNSRSLWNGIFGFGWCADFEKRLDVKSGKIWHCDRETTATTGSKGDSRVFVSKRKREEIYNFRGQLMQIKDSKGLRWDLSYDRQGRLSRIHSAKENYVFVFDHFRLARIDRGKGLASMPNQTVQYRWSGNLLIQTDQNRSGKISSKYRYDDLQNLISIESSASPLRIPSNAGLGGKIQKIEITYFNELDQVRTVRIGECQQDFSFQKISPRKFQSVVSTRCPSQIARHQIFTFTARPLKSGRWKISGDNHEPSLLP